MFILLRPTIFWLIIFIAMLVIEGITWGLTCIWFAAGSLVAMLMSIARTWFLPQLIVCVAVSIVLLLLVRPWALKHFNYGRTRTNAQSLIGQDGVVIEDIDNIRAQGRVSVSGQEWAARSSQEERKFAQGDIVVVREIKGVRLIVDPKEEI